MIKGEPQMQPGEFSSLAFVVNTMLRVRHRSAILGLHLLRMVTASHTRKNAARGRFSAAMGFI